MKVGEDGQIVIPREIGERYGWTPGTEVEAVECGEEVLLRKAEPDGENRDPVTGKTFGEMTPEERSAEFRRWLEQYAGTADAGFTTDEIMQMTRGED